ncbi:MAG: hypothetical protein LDL44_03660 [Caenispirillum sp.]|nr:hypothetical protein [Caenispirillum sp.]
MRAAILAAAVGLLACLLSPGRAVAEERPDGAAISLSAPCWPATAVLAVLEADGWRIAADGDLPGASMLLFSARDGSRWLLYLLTPDSGHACKLAGGSDWRSHRAPPAGDPS